MERKRYIVSLLAWGENETKPARTPCGKRYERSVRKEIAESLKANGAVVTRSYRHCLNGLVVDLTEEEAESLRQDSRVLNVSEDKPVKACFVGHPTSWSLRRMTKRDLPIGEHYFFSTYAEPVKAYIIDTGIQYDHPHFLSGQVIFGFDAYGHGGWDDNGHGTHVAGIVGGIATGVARKCRLVSVKVLNSQGQGTLSDCIAGIDWVIANHGPGEKAVANLSLSAPADTNLDNAVRNLVTDGIFVAVAAGNDSDLASNYSPARVTEVMTVGAVDDTDTMASFSNYGPAVDIFAPGVNIISNYINSEWAYMSGTSMASPHVAGAAAQILDLGLATTPDEVTTLIINNATTGRLQGLGEGSPNRLLFQMCQDLNDVYNHDQPTQDKLQFISEPIDVSSSFPAASGSSISWVCTCPTATSVSMETRVSDNGGVSYGPWQSVVNGGEIPSLGISMANKRVQYRATLSSLRTDATPQLHEVTVTIYPGEPALYDIQHYVDRPTVTITSQLFIYLKLYETLADIIYSSSFIGLKFIEYVLSVITSQSYLDWTWLESLLTRIYSRSYVRELCLVDIAVLVFALVAANEVGFNLIAPDQLDYDLEAEDELSHNLVAVNELLCRLLAMNRLDYELKVGVKP